MIAKCLQIFALLVVCHQLCVAEDPDKPMAGVDPNKISCDPLGEEFLLLPHFTNCSKFFMCAHGEEVEFSCAPGGLVFDFERQTCNWATASKCVLRLNPEEEVEGSGEDWLPENPDEVQSLAFEAARLASKSTYNTVLNCLNAESAAKHIPYKGDCQRYWRCDGGIPKAAYCTDGLFFNERTQQCDFEANVRCTMDLEDELKTEFIPYK